MTRTIGEFFKKEAELYEKQQKIVSTEKLSADKETYKKVSFAEWDADKLSVEKKTASEKLSDK